MKYLCLSAALLLLFFSQCTRKPDTTAAASAHHSGAKVSALAAPVPFNYYWYQGKAELTSYDVEQERYGAMRKAEQVNIFVTEDFSKTKQVKLDDPAAAGADRVPVLKLNSVRRYHTGIYDYSMMQSVFTPLDGSKTLKTTCSVQDWCGHVFTQFNLAGDRYKVREFSYFESEGDQETYLDANALLEDDLWTKLRLDPASIPSGQVRIIPNGFYARMRHQSFKVQTATITHSKDAKEGLLKVEYQSVPRVLVIRYESLSPYRIIAWEESDQGKLMSRGTRKAMRMSAYWSEHDLQHEGLRDSLHLTF